MNEPTTKEIRFDAEASVVSYFLREIERANEQLDATSPASPSRRLYEETRLELLNKIREALPDMITVPGVIEAVSQ